MATVTVPGGIFAPNLGRVSDFAWPTGGEQGCVAYMVSNVDQVIGPNFRTIYHLSIWPYGGHNAPATNTEGDLLIGELTTNLEWTIAGTYSDSFPCNWWRLNQASQSSNCGPLRVPPSDWDDPDYKMSIRNVSMGWTNVVPLHSVTQGTPPGAHPQPIAVPDEIDIGGVDGFDFVLDSTYCTWTDKPTFNNDYELGLYVPRVV